MTEFQRARRVAVEHGWTLELEEYSNYMGCVRATCPAGKILDGDVHQRVIGYDLTWDPNEKREAWKEAADEIRRGAAGALEDCSPMNESCRCAGCFQHVCDLCGKEMYRGTCYALACQEALRLAIEERHRRERARALTKILPALRLV